MKVDMVKYFQDLVMMGELAAELKQAYDYCQDKFNLRSLCKAIPDRPVADVKQLAKQGKVLFSASLGQLLLSSEAIGSNNDTGRIAGILEHLLKLSDLSEMLGTIVVNADSWAGGDAQGLERA